MPCLAICPDGLTASRVPRNNLPPPRLKLDIPLPSHRPHSLWFRKTTRLSDVQIRLFAGRTPWNKVVQVKNSSNVVIVTYGRDAFHRHVTDTVGSTVTDRFFSSDWQLLETKVGSNTVTRNVWSPVYVDSLVLRDRDTDANGTLDERLYALQDANWNTTALVNAGGTVQERYTYTPFGQVTFRDGSGSTLSSSAKDWVFLHQGGERIVAGDYEFRNRVYSPSLGRWFSNDPLGFNAGDQNWYRSIGNNPGNGGDPWGLELNKSSLVVDEIPDVPRNPYGFWVPLGPEDTFLGLIGEDAWDTGKFIIETGLELGYEWTVKPILNTGYFAYDVATCWMPGQFYNPYLNAYQNGNAGYISTVGSITVDAATSYLLLKPVAVGLGGAAGKVIPNPGIPRPQSPVSRLPRTGMAKKADPHHAFPDIVDNYAGDATKFPIPKKGPGGVVVGQADLYQLEGGLKKEAGIFEWIVDQNVVTHRRFIPGGKITGSPNQVKGVK